MKYKNAFIFVTILSLVAFSCKSIKRANLQDIIEDDSFVFQNNNFALFANGIGTFKIYNGRIAVKILKGNIKINPKYDHDSFAVGYIKVGLGEYYEKKKWHTIISSKYRRINKTLYSESDEIDISNIEFEIPFKDENDLLNKWFVFKVINTSNTSAIYTFSVK